MDFKLSDGFFDLCLNVSNENAARLNDVLSRLHQMGYRTVAINQTVDESVFDTDKKKKKKDEGSKELPSPIDLDQLNEQFRGKLCLLNRITFICSDSTKTHTLARCANIKKYDLYAIMPKNQAMLQFACTQLSADLIRIRSSASGLKLNRKLYQQAVERGLCFEIQYADLLEPATRRTAIFHSHLFYTYGKSKNVIISSGAKNVNLIRSPYDIINLTVYIIHHCSSIIVIHSGTLLGLNKNKSKEAILKQCQLLLLRAERRRCGKAIFTVEFTKEPMDEDMLEAENLDT